MAVRNVPCGAGGATPCSLVFSSLTLCEMLEPYADSSFLPEEGFPGIPT